MNKFVLIIDESVDMYTIEAPHPILTDLSKEGVEQELFKIALKTTTKDYIKKINNTGIEAESNNFFKYNRVTAQWEPYVHIKVLTVDEWFSNCIPMVKNEG